MTAIRAFFPKLGHFFPISEKCRGDLPPSPTLVMRLNNYHLARLKNILKSIGCTKSLTVKDFRKRSSDWQLGDLRCSICFQNDVFKNLNMAAETSKKKKKDSSIKELSSVKKGE